MPFVHLHTHSHYSRLEGTTPIKELVKKARSLGMSHLAITETNGLWGFIHFVQTAHHLGVKPVAGSLCRFDDGREILILVEDSRGYENLCRILTLHHQDQESLLKGALYSHLQGLFFCLLNRRLFGNSPVRSPPTAFLSN